MVGIRCVHRRSILVPALNAHHIAHILHIVNQVVGADAEPLPRHSRNHLRAMLRGRQNDPVQGDPAPHHKIRQKVLGAHKPDHRVSPCQPVQGADVEVVAVPVGQEHQPDMLCVGGKPFPADAAVKEVPAVQKNRVPVSRSGADHITGHLATPVFPWSCPPAWELACFPPWEAQPPALPLSCGSGSNLPGLRFPPSGRCRCLSG